MRLPKPPPGPALRSTLVSGPVALPDPPGVRLVKVESAREMEAAVKAALPADIAIFAAAVADWRAARDEQRKIKKDGGPPPPLELAENPDILAGVAGHEERTAAARRRFLPQKRMTSFRLATAKRARKGCDLIVANDVSATSGIAGGVMGGERNVVHLIDEQGAAPAWPEMSKAEVAERLVAEFARRLDDIDSRRGA